VRNGGNLPSSLIITKTSLMWPLAATGWSSSATKYQFKKSDNVVPYSERYEPLLKTENPPKIGAGYIVFDKATDKKVSATGVILLEFTRKGNSVVPFTLKLRAQDLPPGAYHLVLLGVDSTNFQAPQKEIEFTVSKLTSDESNNLAPASNNLRSQGHDAAQDA
jgi:hypothetical protein